MIALLLATPWQLALGATLYTAGIAILAACLSEARDGLEQRADGFGDRHQHDRAGAA